MNEKNKLKHELREKVLENSVENDEYSIIWYLWHTNIGEGSEDYVYERIGLTKFLSQLWTHWSGVKV